MPIPAPPTKSWAQVAAPKPKILPQTSQLSNASWNESFPALPNASRIESSPALPILEDSEIPFLDLNASDDQQNGQKFVGEQVSTNSPSEVSTHSPSEVSQNVSTIFTEPPNVSIPPQVQNTIDNLELLSSLVDKESGTAIFTKPLNVSIPPQLHNAIDNLELLSTSLVDNESGTAIFTKPPNVSIPPKLQNAIDNLELLSSLVDKQSVTFVTIDFEYWILRSCPLLEACITFWDKKPMPRDLIVKETKHYYIIEEHRLKHNQNFLGNHKYNFPDESTNISICKLGSEIKSLIKKAEEESEMLVLVVRGSGKDQKVLADLGCDVSHLKVLDTELLCQALFWKGNIQGNRFRCFSRIHDFLRTKYDQVEVPFHNAVNDRALYTMKALSEMIKMLD